MPEDAACAQQPPPPVHRSAAARANGCRNHLKSTEVLPLRLHCGATARATESRLTLRCLSAETRIRTFLLSPLCKCQDGFSVRPMVQLPRTIDPSNASSQSPSACPSTHQPAQATQASISLLDAHPYETAPQPPQPSTCSRLRDISQQTPRQRLCSPCLALHKRYDTFCTDTTRYSCTDNCRRAHKSHGGVYSAPCGEQLQTAQEHRYTQQQQQLIRKRVSKHTVNVAHLTSHVSFRSMYSRPPLSY